MPDEVTRYTVLPRVLVFVFRDSKLLMMRYSGKGEHMSQEKADRRDIYNCIGGHVEEGEDILETAVKEAKQEAGITLRSPKVKGIINVSGFAGKNVLNFIVTGETSDEAVKTTLEGDLEWVGIDDVAKLNVFPDMGEILNKLFALKNGQMFTGVAKFDGKFKLLAINLKVRN